MVLLRDKLCLMGVEDGDFDREGVVEVVVGVGEEVDFRLLIF